MKNKLLLFLGICFIAFNAFSQTTTTRTEEYCIVRTTNPLGPKTEIDIDSGQVRRWNYGELEVKDEFGKDRKFNSIIDALNYMNGKGWELMETYYIQEGPTNTISTYHYLMRRKIK